MASGKLTLKSNKNKRAGKLTILLIALTALLTTIFTFLFVYEPHNKQECYILPYTLSVEEQHLLNNGDIILREGYGMVSAGIVKKLNERFPVSHCGVILKDTNNNISVVHSLSGSISTNDGVQQCSLSEFEKDCRNNSIIIVRFKGDEKERISKKALYYLQKHIPFDHHFDLSDSSRFFCSELIIRILQDEYNVNIVDEKNIDYTFDMFLNPSFFDVIINHRLNTAARSVPSCTSQ